MISKLAKRLCVGEKEVRIEKYLKTIYPPYKLKLDVNLGKEVDTCRASCFACDRRGSR